VVDLLDRLRADTPGTQRLLHFNNAGASLPTSSVIEAQNAYLQAEAMSGGYELAQSLEGDLRQAYEGLARLLGVTADEVGFCNNASDAWRRLLHALPLPPKARIAYDQSIYGGNLAALLDGRDRFGWELQPVQLADTGEIDQSDLARVLAGGVDLLAITHMPAQSGVVNDLAALSAAGHAHGALVVVDACQTLGQMPIDLGATAVDALIFTGRKYLRAPRGTGGFVVRRPLLDELRPWSPDLQAAQVGVDGELVLTAGAGRLEQWERNWALHAGLGAAIGYLLELDIAWTWRRIQGLAESVVAHLGEVPGVTVRRRSAERGGIVVFDIRDIDLVAARDWLRSRRVNVMFAGSQNAPLEMLGVNDRGWLRASVHYFNTESEIGTFARLVRECAAALG
jgi:cysteine desulfurase / selenocysteine lyase